LSSTPVTPNIFLSGGVSSNGSNSASKSALGLLISPQRATKLFRTRFDSTQLLVDQVSIAISQSNLLKQTRQQVQHEATLNQISRLLHSPLNVVEIRQTVLRRQSALQGSGGRLTSHRNQLASLLNCTPMEISLPYPDLRAFWQQMMSFPKDASQKYSDCDKRYWCLCSQRSTPIHIITDLIKNLSLSFLVPAFKATSPAQS